VAIERMTPASAGFAMPAEWETHAGCLMAWPCRRELWGSRFGEAKVEYAAVARAVAGFEPLTMVCNPGDEAEVRNRCGGEVEILVAPIDDSWMRDSGPIFVRNQRGDIAAVDFEFNAWGERWHPYDNDNRVPEVVAAHLGVPRFRAPFVLEGGAILVDGEGTLLTTEECLLNPNRNPTLSRGQIEQGLRDYLGVSTVLWLKRGHSLDHGPEGTDGHVDGIAQYVAPGHILLTLSDNPGSSEHLAGPENTQALDGARDARGRALDVSGLDPGPGIAPEYCNFYVANGGIIVPTFGRDGERFILARIGELYPGREVVGVPGEVIAFGGGGPHCITQQIPTGGPASL